MLRVTLAMLACGGFVLLGAWDVQACRIPCACLDVDKDGFEDDLVCCGAAASDDLVGSVADGLAEEQACGRATVASPLAPFPEPLAQIAGRISPDGVMGCGCLDADRDGTAEITETLPPGEDCARTAALACLGGHEPPARECASISFDSVFCE